MHNERRLKPRWKVLRATAFLIHVKIKVTAVGRVSEGKYLPRSLLPCFANADLLTPTIPLFCASMLPSLQPEITAYLATCLFPVEKTTQFIDFRRSACAWIQGVPHS